MSKAHPPPVPPAGISPKGPGPQQAPAEDRAAETAEARRAAKDRNLDEQGRQGNIHQNTTHPGMQQDR
ncbi:MAG: hypothetical protein AAGC69_17205 [Paracraurococcus sp.]|jgi:hypothetical protein